ncbi:MAG: AI-2E family transporter [Prevotella sp.]|jgi:predicted PurR-regulated permease PerM|nr:AI-2E family transporter [Prevotella sp.]
MLEGKITFDRMARWVLMVAVVITVIYLINLLGSVLLPFFVGWLLAYLLYPMVKFVQYRMHVPSRPLAIVVTLLVVGIVLAGVFYFIIPPMIEQFERLGDVLMKYLNQQSTKGDFSAMIHEWLNQNRDRVMEFFSSRDFIDTLKTTMPGVFSFVGRTANIIISIVASCITLLYMFFILLDYEYLTNNWVRIFPKKSRPFWISLMGDVERELNNYIRGQGLVALCMGVMFCIGFTIIDFPMAIGLGILIGIMDLVPYLHTFALIPTAFLALLKAADTGQNFWIIFGLAVLVFIVVQIITDMVTTPKIMGSAMGLNPAILLLSLSVWGTLLGFIGLIIALPLTTLLIAYYQRYVTKDELPDVPLGDSMSPTPIENPTTDESPATTEITASETSATP